VVHLPLAEEPAYAGSRKSATSSTLALAPKRVLVVDDNRDAAESLGMLLTMLGATVHVSYSGTDALKALATHKPSVVLLDIGMPEMDGYEVARRIRELPDFRDVTLIALTGWGQDKDRRRSHRAGFDFHLTKPANVDALETLLVSLEGRA
jgi:CheY-like chemotaxis protein